MILVYGAAAFFEIVGCFAVWAWLREGRNPLWVIPGAVCLLVFAFLLTLVSVPHAGRAYAAYGGIYIGASLLWLWLVEKSLPDRWDMTGAALCLVGIAVILFAPRPI